nr:hypothetical protein [Acetomicrobium sp. S15 = DSM 107314]
MLQALAVGLIDVLTLNGFKGHPSQVETL